jgi:hypothetical protein
MDGGILSTVEVLHSLVGAQGGIVAQFGGSQKRQCLGLFICFLNKTKQFHYVAQTGLELTVLLSAGIQVCTCLG